jgi:hypothetical protein
MPPNSLIYIVLHYITNKYIVIQYTPNNVTQKNTENNSGH